MLVTGTPEPFPQNLNFIISIFELVHPQKMVLLNPIVILYFRRSVISARYGFAGVSKMCTSHKQTSCLIPRSNKQGACYLHADRSPFISMKIYNFFCETEADGGSWKGQCCFQLRSWFPSLSPATSTM